MHFFNPAPLMRLVEVIAADQSSERALTVAAATGEAMGRRVIRAHDGPGFLVNRCGRPFYSEALRLLQERVATAPQVDRIYRLGGGFRMGPFELMDLVGVDTGLEVARSFNELSFGEPRWKPSPLQARMVAAGRLGRKAGRGWYEYGDGPHRPDDPEPPAPAGGDGRLVAIEGDGALAAALRERAEAAGFRVSGWDDLESRPELLVWARPEPPATAPGGGTPAAAARSAGAEAGDGAVPLLLGCSASSLAAAGLPHAAGFNAVPPLALSKLLELTRLPSTPDSTVQAAERFAAALGFLSEWVEDAPGLVLGRVVCQLVNEACFAVGEGVGSPEDVDAGMELGLNHPRGPLAWGREMGFADVLATIDGLWEERREERYRAAPLLRRAARLGTLA